MWFARLGLKAVLRSSGFQAKQCLSPEAAPRISRKISFSPILADQDRIYTSEQRELIIEKLNLVRTDPSVRNLLGIKLATHFESHLSKHGNFSKLEELLKVPSVGPKTVRNVCDKILGIRAQSEKTPGGKSVSRKARMVANVVSPSLSEKTRSEVKEVVAVVMDECSVSWAHIDVKKKYLLGWDSVEIEGNLSLIEIIHKALGVEACFPNADLYILEEPAAAMSKSRSGYHSKSIMTIAVATSLLSKREEEGQLKLAFVKSKLVEKHFEAVVGSETVSLQPFMQDVIDQKLVAGRSNLFISHELVNNYRNAEPMLREQLSRAALLSITCVDLVLKKPNISESETLKSNVS